jgi:nicotinamide-nucleotide amidase
VGDREAEIKEALHLLLNKSDVLIIGGGLGPTHDDITMGVLSHYFKIPLEHDPIWMKEVEKIFSHRKRAMTENNKKQALLLKGATRIDNDCGTAAGQYFEEGRTSVFVVPGVPHEMKSMLERFILPRLQSRLLQGNEKIKKATLLTTGMGESALAERLDPFVKKIASIPGLTLAFLPNLATVRLRLQMKTHSPEEEIRFDSLVEELRLACGVDYFGMEPYSIEEQVMRNLAETNRTLALAESCTGGLISHRMTQVPGASKTLRGTLVAYQESLKSEELGIPPEMLTKQGVVSEATARAMAESIRRKWGTDFGLATTGYLGPSGGDAFAAVGTVWIALAREGETLSREFRYENNRERSKERAAQSAIDFLRRHL